MPDLEKAQLSFTIAIFIALLIIMGLMISMKETLRKDTALMAFALAQEIANAPPSSGPETADNSDTPDTPVNVMTGHTSKKHDTEGYKSSVLQRRPSRRLMNTRRAATAEKWSVF